MQRFSDTIVAHITGKDPAAVAVVRISGPLAVEIGQNFTKKRLEHAKAIYTQLPNADDALIVPLLGPHSFTGEDVVEISCHGSSASVQSLVELCIANGARLAEHGEFSQRAFLNGKIDLSQAEGILETVNAQTTEQLQAAHHLRSGQLGKQVGDIRSGLHRVLLEVEARVDFLEELGEVDEEHLCEMLTDALQELRALRGAEERSTLVREGLRVVLVGLPNAGKSSLFNALLKHERAIVTATPGTTRDTLEESIDCYGYKVVLVDTAGIRNSADEIENMGVERSITAAQNSDLILHLFDSLAGWQDANTELADRLPIKPTLKVLTKCDLSHPSPPGPLSPKMGKREILSVSSVTGAGIDELASCLANQVAKKAGNANINPRHASLLDQTIDSVETSLEILQSRQPSDLISVTLGEALYSLGQITGETATPDMLTEIFANFCIGK